MIQKRTIGIVGAGHVGMAAAYAVFLRGLAGEIIVVDQDHRRAEGEAMDLMHGQAFVERVSVRAGEYADLAAAQVVVISAGVAQKPDETRLALLNRNAAVLRQIIAQLDAHTPGSVLIIASNPVDILTHVTQALTRRPAGLVIGTGTMLDTARFRALLGDYYGVDPRSVHAYILGEHGDSEVPIWSSAHIGGVPLMDNTILGKTFAREEMERIFQSVRHAAYEILSRKGYTNTAIGSSIARLVEAILDDQRSVLPVSRQLTGQHGIDGVCLSIPSIIGQQGVTDALLLRLNDVELDGLRYSAQVLRESLQGIQVQAE
ncbi:MAG: lactate dehydrogenase [Desulfatitalea sp. BRH_c12]|nr:MAG: lactate dehydrogenase [Desulfatitalea sp. BRH_c12]